MHKVNISKIFSPNIQILLNLFEGKKIYMVGGCVRDVILGKSPKDIDFCTNLTPDEIITLVPKSSNINIIEVGKSFGVIKLIINDEEFEIATFRKDVGEGRRPDSVEFTDEETDIQRRDLTINGLLLKIINESEGEVIDYCNGLEDIYNKVIRTIGKPEDRFREDPLRKLRAIRFAATMNFKLMGDTLNAIKADPSLDGVSAERIREEWIKALENNSCNKNKYISLLFETQLITSMFYNLISLFHGFNDAADSHYLIELFRIISKNLYLHEIKEYLHLYKFTDNEIKDIVALYHIEHDLNDESKFHTLKNLNLRILKREDVLRYFSLDKYNLINKFLNWKPWVDSMELMSRGFQGKELGEKIRELEFERFYIKN